MASIALEPNGRRRICFSDGVARKTLRLGAVDKKTAEGVLLHVERLINSTAFGQPLPVDTAGWVARASDDFHARMAAVGLVQPRQAVRVVTLAAVIDGFTLRRSAGVKTATTLVWKQARNQLVGYFGADRDITTITPADADDFRRHMVGKYSEAYTAKMVMVAKAFLRDSVRRKLLDASPFADLINGSQRNPARQQFIDQETIYKCIDAAPDVEWRLMIGLARFGGLRVPSEPLALRWSDINWAGHTMTVRSPKTEHHAGGGSRVVPIFAELRPLLQDAFDQAAEGEDRVITQWQTSAVNLRTHFQRIIERAGVEPWPRLWQNLRASRATELADRYPSHACAAWLGHTETVADRHYRQVTSDHIAAAAGVQVEAAAAADQNSRAGAKASGGRAAVKAAQNPALQPPATSCGEQKQNASAASKMRILREATAGCDPLQGGGWAIQDSNL